MSFILAIWSWTTELDSSCFAHMICYIERLGDIFRWGTLWMLRSLKITVKKNPKNGVFYCSFLIQRGLEGASWQFKKYTFGDQHKLFQSNIHLLTPMQEFLQFIIFKLDAKCERLCILWVWRILPLYLMMLYMLNIWGLMKCKLQSEFVFTVFTPH